MKKKYLQFCDFIAKACGAFAVLALLLSILVIVELSPKHNETTLKIHFAPDFELTDLLLNHKARLPTPPQPQPQPQPQP